MADDNSQLISSLMGMLGDNPQEKISAVLSSLTGNQNAAAQDISSGADSQPDVSDGPPAGADKSGAPAGPRSRGACARVLRTAGAKDVVCAALARAR